MFLFDAFAAARVLVDVWSLSAQSSKAGSGSLITVPTPWLSGEASVYVPGAGTWAPVFESTSVKPWVWPEIRLSAPGVEGPNVIRRTGRSSRSAGRSSTAR